MYHRTITGEKVEQPKQNSDWSTRVHRIRCNGSVASITFVPTPVDLTASGGREALMAEAFSKLSCEEALPVSYVIADVYNGTHYELVIIGYPEVEWHQKAQRRIYKAFGLQPPQTLVQIPKPRRQ